MSQRASFLLVLLLIGLFVPGCRVEPTVESDALQVTVSIVPQRYFLERIGGDRVSVNVMVLPGENPATYEPKPEQLKALSRSAAYLRIGVAFEDAWMDRISAANQDMLIVDTRQGIELIPIAAHDDHGESAAGDDPHSDGEGNLDPHIWLSPDLVRTQANIIRDALVQVDPEHRDLYTANLVAFGSELDDLQQDIGQKLAGVVNRKFMVFHPSWGYFAKDFGLEMVAIEVGGQEPSAAELADLIGEARKEGVKVIFAQPEFSTRAAETIARQIGGIVLLISPLAYDWADNLTKVADTLGQVLGE